MRWILITLIAFWCVNSAQAAVAIDSGSPVAISAGTGATFTGTVTTSGADNVLVVIIHAYIAQATSDSAASGCTYNTVGMTLLTTVNWPTAGGQILEDDVWYLKSPAIGADSLVCTFNSAIGEGSNWMGGTAFAVAFSGTSSSTPVGSLESNNTASAQTISIASLTGTVGANDLYLTYGNSAEHTVVLTGTANMTNYLSNQNGSQGEYSLDTIAGSQTGNAATYSNVAAANYFIIGAIPILSGTALCTNKSYTQAGAIAVPVANSTDVWLSGGTFGTVDCATKDYWQTTGGVFGVS